MNVRLTSTENKITTVENLMYSLGNSTQCSAVIKMGNEKKTLNRGGIYIYIYIYKKLINFAVQHKLA